jgi:hypothetical protein
MIIPRVIHRFIDPPITNKVNTVTDRWRRLHPRWLVREWQLPVSDATSDFSENNNRFIEERFAFAVQVLYDHGGFLVGPALFPRMPLDDLPIESARAMAVRIDDARWATSLMAASKHGRFATFLVSSLPSFLSEQRCVNPVTDMDELLRIYVGEQARRVLEHSSGGVSCLWHEEAARYVSEIR